MREHVERRHGSRTNFLLRLRYGISEDELEMLMVEQGGLCAICRIHPAEHVDHCHETGRVRGLLCFNCNGALGRLEEDTSVMERAIEYLVAHGHG